MKKMICLIWLTPLFLLSACITEVTAPFCTSDNMKQITGFEGEYFFALDDLEVLIQSDGNGHYQFESLDDDEDDEPMSFKVCEVNSRQFIEIPSGNGAVPVRSTGGQGQIFELKQDSQSGDFTMLTLVANQELMNSEGVSYTSTADNHAVIENNQLSAGQLLRYLSANYAMKFEKL